jgi:hypothetical protein
MAHTTITSTQAAQLIRESRGRFLGCTFIKRSTGGRRKMWFRYAAVGHIAGDHHTRIDTITVRDAHKKAWRAIPVEGICELRIEGMILEVNDD